MEQIELVDYFICNDDTHREYRSETQEVFHLMPSYVVALFDETVPKHT